MTPSSWHGTSTASLVGAATNNSIGMAGTAPGVRVLPLRVLGKCFGRDSDIQAAMRYAADIAVDGVPANPTPAKVINLSLGGNEACSAAYQATVDEVLARGVVVVAAAGNSAGEPVGSPASCNGVLAVAAVRHAGTKVGFSDLGAQIAIAAPGGNCVNIGANQPCLYPILAALNSGFTVPQNSVWSDSYDITVGTSFAAPLVAGVVGLMFSHQPMLTVAQVRTALQATARPFPSTGADNGPGDPTPVTNCVAPRAGVQQPQCYCPNPGAASYPLCGAGMLDAGAALNAAGATLAAIDSAPAAPVAGTSVTLNSSRSLAAPGTTIVAWNWSIVSGGGIVSAFSSSTNAATAALTPTAAGTAVVRLSVTDSAGGSATTTHTLVVSAAPSSPPPGNGGGGGGALSGLWLALLALAVAALARLQHRGRTGL